MQPAAHFVPAPIVGIVEFPSGVQDGQDGFQSRDLRGGMEIGGDAPSVVGYGAAVPSVGGGVVVVVVKVEGDEGGVPRQGLVDGIVEHFVDEVVEAVGSGGSDVHSGAFADRFEAREDGDLVGRVGGGGGGSVCFGVGRGCRGCCCRGGGGWFHGGGIEGSFYSCCGRYCSGCRRGQPR